jgi:hypothetical protein
MAANLREHPLLRNMGPTVHAVGMRGMSLVSSAA